MFCSHCGKKLEKGQRFCSACGNPVNWDSKEKTEQDEENIYPISYTNEDHVVEEKEEKYQQGEYHNPNWERKNSNLIKEYKFGLFVVLTILTMGIYGVYVLYTFGKDVDKVCKGDGRKVPNYILAMLLSLVTFGVYGVYWVYIQQQRLYEASRGYGATVNENGNYVVLWSTLGALLCGLGPLITTYTLMKSLNQIGYQYNQGKVNYDLNTVNPVKMGTLPLVFCIIGAVIWTLGVILNLVIAGALYGIVASSASENYEYDYYNESWGEAEEWYDASNDPAEYYIELVKTGYVDEYAYLTYGDAFDAFFGNPNWSYFYSDGMEDIVAFEGSCMVEDTEVMINLQFLVDEEMGTFDVIYYSIDYEPQPLESFYELLTVVFESY